MLPISELHYPAHRRVVEGVTEHSFRCSNPVKIGRYPTQVERESGTEYEAQVNILRRSDNTLLEHRLYLACEGILQGSEDVRGRAQSACQLCPDFSSRAPARTSIAALRHCLRGDFHRPGVKADDVPPFFFVEKEAVIGKPVQSIARVKPITKRGVMNIKHVCADPEADEIKQRWRWHWQAERGERLVHLCKRPPPVNGPQRLTEQHREQPVDGEAGGIRRAHCVFLEFPCNDKGGCQGCLVAHCRCDNLNQRHHRDGCEKIEPDEPFRVLQLRTDV